jgi:maleylpyruvate isomerase
VPIERGPIERGPIERGPIERGPIERERAEPKQLSPEQTLAWMNDGTERLLAGIAALPDAALDAPTALPGWSRRYLLSHIAANAEALRNLVHWARTGEERRMYASAAQREADIAAGALRPAAELRDVVSATAAALAADLDELGHAATQTASGNASKTTSKTTSDTAAGVTVWDAKIVTAQGLTRPAREIPWMRVREVYIHLVDLDAGTTFADLPHDFLTALLDDVTTRRTANGGGPALAIAATDTGHAWEVVGTGSHPIPVSAPLADLAAYLTGRPSPELKAAPALPAWM